MAVTILYLKISRQTQFATIKLKTDAGKSSNTTPLSLKYKIRYRRNKKFSNHETWNPKRKSI